MGFITSCFTIGAGIAVAETGYHFTRGIMKGIGFGIAKGIAQVKAEKENQKEESNDSEEEA